MDKIGIDQNQCKKDGLCVMVCPMNILIQKEKDAIPSMVHGELCISCGHCLAICPHGAITHDDFPQERIQPILREHLPASEMIVHLMNVRRSVRTFKNTSIKKETIEQIIYAARSAPSGHNAQSTEYIVVQNQDTLTQVVQLTTKYFRNLSIVLGNTALQPAFSWLLRNRFENLNLLAKEFELLVQANKVGKDVILHRATALIIFHARQNAVFAGVNANLAAQNASLLAQSLGLGAFYTGYVVTACENDNSIPRLLDIPKNHRIYAGLALGHPAVRFTHWMEKGTPKIRWL
jgi:nitroreductase/NAD-dependent dihydropyrimidine dehydrogenase PreA subunit